MRIDGFIKQVEQQVERYGLQPVNLNPEAIIVEIGTAQKAEPWRNDDLMTIKPDIMFIFCLGRCEQQQPLPSHTY